MSGTGIDVPNLPIVSGNGIDVVPNLPIVSGTGIDGVPKLRKCPVPV